MNTALRTLLPPGGFSNLVGLHLATLDLELAALEEVARSVPAGALERAPHAAVPSVAQVLRTVGAREAAVLHAALGKVPTPPAPGPAAGAPALLGWLEAVRLVSLMVLRPLADRDLERLIEVPGVPGRTTLRRVLVDLTLEHAERRGEATLAARMLSTR